MKYARLNNDLWEMYEHYTLDNIDSIATGISIRQKVAAGVGDYDTEILLGDLFIDPYSHMTFDELADMATERWPI